MYIYNHVYIYIYINITQSYLISRVTHTQKETRFAVPRRSPALHGTSDLPPAVDFRWQNMGLHGFPSMWKKLNLPQHLL